MVAGWPPMAVTMTERMAVATAIAAMTVPDHPRKSSPADRALLPTAPLPVQREPPRSAPVNPDMADISTVTAMASAANELASLAQCDPVKRTNKTTVFEFVPRDPLARVYGSG